MVPVPDESVNGMRSVGASRSISGCSNPVPKLRSDISMTRKTYSNVWCSMQSLPGGCLICSGWPVSFSMPLKFACYGCCCTVLNRVTTSVRHPNRASLNLRWTWSNCRIHPTERSTNTGYENFMAGNETVNGSRRHIHSTANGWNGQR